LGVSMVTMGPMNGTRPRWQPSLMAPSASTALSRARQSGSCGAG